MEGSCLPRSALHPLTRQRICAGELWAHRRVAEPGYRRADIAGIWHPLQCDDPSHHAAPDGDVVGAWRRGCCAGIIAGGS